MPRMARVVIPGMAHHVTRRGNRRGNVFFDDVQQVYTTTASGASRRFRGKPSNCGICPFSRGLTEEVKTMSRWPLLIAVILTVCLLVLTSFWIMHRSGAIDEASVLRIGNVLRVTGLTSASRFRLHVSYDNNFVRLTLRAESGANSLALGQPGRAVHSRPEEGRLREQVRDAWGDMKQADITLVYLEEDPNQDSYFLGASGA